MNKFRLLMSACTLLLACSWNTPVNAETMVIVNAKNSLGSLSADEAKRIFLAKKTNFDDGNKIEVVDQADGSAIRTEFYPKVTEKSADQARSRWAALLFSGEGQIPPAKNNDAEVIEFVAGNPNAIGYVSATNNDARVKSVLQLP